MRLTSARGKSAHFYFHPIGLALKFFQRTAAYQAALVEKSDLIADLLYFGELMRAEENAFSCMTRIAQQLAYLLHSCGVERRRRLVEDQQFRIVDQGLGKSEPLLHTP